MREKLIRDPVHDVIAFRVDREEDALLFRLINAREFQRLRRIRQLGMASLAYPGADHSRYSHSIGVMETARRMLNRLQEAYPVDPADRVACLSAALLHDLGHGPFSHVFERVSGLDHEQVTIRVVSDPGSEVHQMLESADPTLPGRVARLLGQDGPRTFLEDVLSSQLDADRLDYLLRDNLFTGSGYGGFDLRWLLQAMTVDESSRRLAIAWKGVSAVESYLQSRYHMYRNVYFHKVVRASEGMVKLALQRAKRLAVQGRLPVPRREDPVCKALLGQRLTGEEFVELDDIAVMHCFKEWCASDDATLAGLCRGLLYRRLYKTIDLSRLPPAGAAQVVAEAWRSVERLGGDPSYDVFFDEVSDTPYRTYDPTTGEVGSEILVCEPGGRLVEFASISPAATTLNQQLVFRRIHVSDGYADAVRAVAARA